MIVAIDVHYRENFAKIVSIEFQDWEDILPSIINEIQVTEFDEYISGEFYKRELPCILQILKASKSEEIEFIVIDGYVVLNDLGKAGLGKYLYETLDQKIPIIGVAKRGFANNEKNVQKIFRGKSKNPLYISSIGIDLKIAAEKIKQMSGDYRMPDLLRILDRKTKE